MAIAILTCIVDMPVVLAATPQPKLPVVEHKPVDKNAIKKRHKKKSLTEQQQLAKSGFRLKPGPPPGFSQAEVDRQQTTFVSIYFGGHFIGNEVATFDHHKIQLSNVKKIVTAIDGIKQPKKIIHALTGFVSTHEDYLCSHQNSMNNGNNERPYCKTLTPKVAGIILDPNRFRVDLFVNPKYLDVSNAYKFHLPPSSAGFSALNQNTFLVSGDQDTQTYTLLNQGEFGYRNNHVTSYLTYTENHVNHGQSFGQLNFEQLTAGRYANGHLYQAGMLTPQSGSLLSGQPILGVSVENHGVVNESRRAGTPLVVYLTFPSQVSVYKGDHLISVQSLPSGKQQLDTRSFPTGSYNVRIVVVDQYGHKTQQTQFFVKQSQLPGPNHPNYQLSLGALQTNNNLSQIDTRGTSFPQFTDTAVLNYTETRTFTQQWSLQSTLLTDFDQVYGSSQVNFFNNGLTLSPGAMVSDRNTYGLSFTGDYEYESFNIASNIIKILSSNEDKLQQRLLQTNRGFDPISVNDFQANLATSLSWSGNSLSLTNTWLKSFGSPTEFSYGVNYGRSLYSSGSTSVNFNASLTRSFGNTTAMATITINFFTQSINSSLAVGYLRNQNNIPGQQRDLATINANVNKNIQFNSSTNLNVGMNYNHQAPNDTYSGNISYQSNLLQAQVNVSRSDNGRFNSTTTYNGTFITSLAFTHNHFTVSNNRSLLTGLLVNVKAPKDVPVQVYVNNQQKGIVVANHPRAIFLPDYRTYHVTVSPQANSLYSYSKTPQVVTLYKGNMQYLEWRLDREYILFTQIVSPKGKALPNLLLLHTKEFDTTDAHGYLQAGLPEHKKTLSFRSMEGQDCKVTLPQHINIDQGVAVLKKPLICALHFPKKTKEPESS